MGELCGWDGNRT